MGAKQRRCARPKPFSLGALVLALAACTESGAPPTMRVSPDAGTPTHDAAVDAPLPDGDLPDAAAPDAATPDASVAAPPARYAADVRHSRINAHVVAELARIRANDPALRDDVLAKLGDSITVSTSFLRCFAGSRVNLDGRTGLADTIAHFRAGDAAGATPYERETLSAGVGWSAWRALEGAPSPVVQELDAIQPRFAVVMYGTNDVGSNTPTRYADNMLDLVDTLIERGVVPVVSSFPPLDANPAADARIPLYTAILRALAEARQVPFVDLHAALEALPGHGLGPDDIHPSTAPSGACDFSATGLGYGYDVRNLVTIEALDRARRVVVADEPAPDADGPLRIGRGTSADPYVIDALPFTDSRNTAFATERLRATYSGCSSTANEGGAELVYTLELTAPRRVDAWVFDRGMVDIDVHVLDASGSEAGCMARNDTHVSIELPAGRFTIVLDTYVASGAERAGEYLFVVL